MRANKKSTTLHSEVEKYIEKVDNPGRREDALVLAKLLQEITGEPVPLRKRA